MASRYGKISNDNREQYKNDINFLYHREGQGPASISKLLGIGEVTVERLIVYDQSYIASTTYKTGE